MFETYHSPPNTIEGFLYFATISLCADSQAIGTIDEHPFDDSIPTSFDYLTINSSSTLLIPIKDD